MNESDLKIKLSYIGGLKPIVLKELKNLGIKILEEADDSLYLPFSKEVIPQMKQLRSVARAYLVIQNDKFHPTYISNHKSILKNLIDLIIEDDIKSFKSFKVSCAGSDSPEVKSIVKYIEETYSIEEKEEADLKIHIIKPEKTWEIGIQITSRPLSLRGYKVVNMSGAMDPTIAYAVNSFCNLKKAKTYLNIFSGSATLLIEAGQSFPNLEKLVGFDNEKKRLSLSIQNVKKAGLIKKVSIKEADIFDKPDFGKFDAIASDLPFGMLISKNEDLLRLYKEFVGYCEEKLESKGKLVVYTSQYELFESVISNSRFKILESIQLKLITNANRYIKPKIIVCQFKG